METCAWMVRRLWPAAGHLSVARAARANPDVWQWIRALAYGRSIRAVYHADVSSACYVSIVDRIRDDNRASRCCCCSSREAARASEVCIRCRNRSALCAAPDSRGGASATGTAASCFNAQHRNEGANQAIGSAYACRRARRFARGSDRYDSDGSQAIRQRRKNAVAEAVDNACGQAIGLLFARCSCCIHMVFLIMGRERMWLLLIGKISAITIACLLI